jgi:hypothetical protein
MVETNATESWSMHMIQGMGRVVQFMPSAAKSTPLSEKLITVYRRLEISRAILYGTSTGLGPVHAGQVTDTAGSSALNISLEYMLEASLFTHR